jgi:hypothetical protein
VRKDLTAKHAESAEKKLTAKRTERKDLTAELAESAEKN